MSFVAPNVGKPSITPSIASDTSDHGWRNARTAASPSCRSAATPSSAQRHVSSVLITTVSKRLRVANNLEHLRAIHADIAAMKLDISDIKQRMGAVEQHNAIKSSEIANARFDGFDGRLARIEQRLDLIDAD